MGEYAKNTTVAVEKSKAELERTLQRFGAESVVMGADRHGVTRDTVYDIGRRRSWQWLQ